jgi:transposase
MAERIIEKKLKNNYYYYYRVSYRVKVDTTQVKEKTKGSGKSRVVNDDIYLGTAKTILEKVKGESKEPIFVFEHGIESALLTIAEEIGLVTILNELLPKKTIAGIPLSTYILMAVINRICDVRSKRAMHVWLKNSSFRLRMHITAQAITSQKFWNAFDIIIPQKEVYKKQKELLENLAQNETRRTKKDRKLKMEEIESLLDDTVLTQIEDRLLEAIIERFKVRSALLYYDTTNFFNYHWHSISELSKRGRNKKNRNDKRQVGLALCVLWPYGIPLFSFPYAGNIHDAKVFKHVADKIIERFKKFQTRLKQLNERVIFICDKGNNSKENISLFDEEIRDDFLVIGALTPYQHQDLCRIKHKELEKTHKDFIYTTRKKICYGKERKVVIAFNEKLYREHRKTFRENYKDALIEIEEAIKKYNQTEKKKKGGKKCTIEALSRKINKIPAKFNVSGCFTVTLKKENGHVCMQKKLTITHIKNIYHRMGKLLFFAAKDNGMEGSEIIDYYRAKYIVEDVFKTLNHQRISPYSPMWHWTDSKIRIHSFVCVLAVTLIRLLEMKAKEVGIDISTRLMLDELRAIKLCIIGKSIDSPQKRLNQLSHTQQALKEAFSITSDI